MKYTVTGIFDLMIDAEDMKEAWETAKRILQTSGIDGNIIQVEEEKTDDSDRN